MLLATKMLQFAPTAASPGRTAASGVLDESLVWADRYRAFYMATGKPTESKVPDLVQPQPFHVICKERVLNTFLHRP